MTEARQQSLPMLTDPVVRRAHLDALDEQRRVDLHAPEPLARFHAELALERIRAVREDLRTGVWSPTSEQRQAVRRAFEARRAEPPGTPEQMPEPGTRPPGWLAASQAARDAHVAEQLHAILSTPEGRGANRHQHITAFAWLVSYTGGEFAGRNDDRFESLTAVVRPAVTAAVYLWSDLGWPDQVDDDF